jgi:hypothetical protein
MLTSSQPALVGQNHTLGTQYSTDSTSGLPAPSSKLGLLLRVSIKHTPVCAVHCSLLVLRYILGATSFQLMML